MRKRFWLREKNSLFCSSDREKNIWIKNGENTNTNIDKFKETKQNKEKKKPSQE